MVMPSQEQILSALKAVYDPELGLSIVDLGLVYRAVVEGRTVKIDMTLTTPACPLGSVIRTRAFAVLTSQFVDIEDVTINLVWDPPWDPRTMASEDVKLELGLW